MRMLSLCRVFVCNRFSLTAWVLALIVLVFALFVYVCFFYLDICRFDAFKDGCQRPHPAQGDEAHYFKTEVRREKFSSLAGDIIGLTKIVNANSIYAVSSSPDGKVFLGGGVDAKIIQVNSDEENWGVIELFEGIKVIDDIKFLNNEKAVAVGSEGRIYQSADGGVSWVLYNPEFPFGKTNPWLNSLRFDEAYTVAFADERYGLVGGIGRLLNTKNGGKTWHSIDVDADTVFEKIILKSDRSGWAATNRGLLRTKDGGNTWGTIFSFNKFFYGRLEVFALDYVENGLLCFSERYDVYCSDTSESFNKANVEWSGKPRDRWGRVSGIKMINSRVGWFITDTGEIYRTEDGARNWKLWVDVMSYMKGNSDCLDLDECKVALYSIASGVDSIYVVGKIEMSCKVGAKIYRSLSVLLNWKVSSEEYK
ncbi:YCF48-related protein [Pseudomonas sp. DP-17]|uniref:YCF48-related protein n=1 Tax=Pseudomonas sp. DP-17 TaxID=1580486 RepID=UPI001EFBB63F|nr:YCF48-related protein [Pseudomonas sp. DP-17]MCG8906953.1 YCF48-related protein [Pseudomonas sp. DP-17]